MTRWNHVKPDYLDILVSGEGASEPGTKVTPDSGDENDSADAAHRTRGLLPELATLDARLLQQLAVLLLGHALAPLLDDRTHGETFQQPIR